MKSIDWLALTRIKMSRVLGIVALVAFAFACSDGSEDVATSADASARKNNLNANNDNSNCESAAADYIIGAPLVEGATWTYTITTLPGAKCISHFIIDLNNCPGAATPLSAAAITNATVNGAPANVSSSEGNGTGCVVDSDSFIKFDEIACASTYVISFTLPQVFGNNLATSAWIKAGCSCHEYTIQGPCCPQ